MAERDLSNFSNLDRLNLSYIARKFVNEGGNAGLDNDDQDEPGKNRKSKAKTASASSQKYTFGSRRSNQAAAPPESEGADERARIGNHFLLFFIFYLFLLPT
jgi:hypothetical protein